MYSLETIRREGEKEGEDKESKKGRREGGNEEGKERRREGKIKKGWKKRQKDGFSDPRKSK